MSFTRFLDNGTLAVVFSAGTLSLALFLLVLRSAMPHYKGLLRFAFGDVVLGFGFFTLFFFADGHPWLGIVIPNTLIVLGRAFMGNGQWGFLEKSAKWSPLGYLPAVVAFPALAFFTFIVPSVFARIFLMSLILAVQFGASGIVLLTNFPYSKKGAARFTAAVYISLSIFFFIRIPVSRDETIQVIFSPSSFQSISLLVMIIGAIAWNFGLLLMAATRMAEELAAHEIEAGLRKRDHLVKTIIDTLPQSIVFKDKDSRYLACNAAFARVVGKTPEELIGAGDDEHRPSEASRNRAADLAVMRSGESWESFERVDSNGRERWVDTIRTPVRDESGEIQGVLTVFRDVTDRVLSERALQESERRYRDLSAELERRVERRTAELKEAKRDIDLFFEVTVEYLCILDFEGRFLKLSPSWTKQLGWHSEELVGRPLIDFVHQNDREATLRASAEFVSGERVVSFQNRFRRADGGWIWLSWSSVGVPDRALVIAAAHDVTERMETEERLNAAREEAERASRSKSQFISTMSHELRTPLNAVLGYGKLLEGIVEDERGLGYLRSIGSAGRALLAIINDLLDLTKAESGRIELTPIPADPRSILDELAEIFRFGAEEKGLALEFKATSRVPKTILLDAPRLRQVLINLVGNAVKFTDQGEVKVSMDAADEDRTAAKDDPRATWKATLKIEVVDTGIGIDENYRAHLFESFSQQDVGISRRYGGTGLGLAIAKRLLDLMGGTIRCEAGDEGGTKFKIEIPSVTVAGTAPETLAFIGGPVPRGPAAKTAANGRKRRILVVDDEVGRARALDALAELDGNEPEWEAAAANREDALRQAYRADLILLGGEDVFDTCRALKADPATAEIPIILIMEAADRERILQGYHVGAADYLASPYDPGELRARARTQLELRRTREELNEARAGLSAAGHSIQEKNMKLEGLMAQLERQSVVDDLTGIANRKAIAARLINELARSRRAGTSVSVLIGDLDRFKAINDQLGSQAGDAALAECARRFAEALREGDAIGRWVGDEFLAVLPDTRLEEAASAAERVRKHLARLPLACGASSARITVSIGVSALTPRSDDDAEAAAAALIRAAGDALYRAKTKGLDRVESLAATLPIERQVPPSAVSFER